MFIRSITYRALGPRGIQVRGATCGRLAYLNKEFHYGAVSSHVLCVFQKTLVVNNNNFGSIDSIWKILKMNMSN